MCDRGETALYVVDYHARLAECFTYSEHDCTHTSHLLGF